MNRFDAVTNLAFFLLKKTGSVNGTWKGHLSAKEQRELFGAFFGKGLLVIDGSAETISHIIKVCFGLDYDVTATRRFAEAVSYIRNKQDSGAAALCA